jgi:hypothetical protein
VIFAILIGAQAGSWDAANGTLRYQVMTGRPRLTLYLLRLPALVSAILTFLAPAALIGLVAALALPTDGDPSITAHDIGNYFAGLLTFTLTYGLISMGIGALFRSSGAGIAVALTVNLIGLNVLAVLSELNETLGDLMLPNVTARVTGADDAGDLSLAVAAIALALWIAAFVAAGGLRTVRSEY